MTDIIIKSFDDLKDVVIENLKEGTVLIIDLSGRGDEEDD